MQSGGAHHERDEGLEEDCLPSEQNRLCHFKYDKVTIRFLDLVPREVVESWMKHLRQFAPTIAFKCSTQRQRTNLGQSRNRTMESKSSVCLGADNLIQLLKNYARSEQVKTSITVGVVGLPNVGKSSVINSLKRSKATHVGNRPGTDF